VTPPPPIRLSDLTCLHDRIPAVHHLSGVFDPGSLTAVVGPNGAGKTTLLRAIAGLHEAAQGRIDRGGLGPGRIALLAQAGTLDRRFPVTCGDVVALGAWARNGPFRRLSRDTLDHAADALRQVGLGGFERRLVGTLSAGQFQRVLFARLVVQDASLVLLDEPFNAVDGRTAAELMGLIRQWHAEGRTIVAVLHDLDLVAREFPDTLLLARELIAWGPTAATLSAEHRMQARLAAETWAEDPQRRLVAA
jgi:zinc/manganese transport system ATP-binding protein